MSLFERISSYAARFWSWLDDDDDRDAPARDLDEANRSAYLDDVFYAALLGPHI